MEHNMQVIGLTGYAGSGKSTVANYLVEQHGFTRLSFAKPLKDMLRKLNPFISEGGDRTSYVLHELGEGCVKQSFPEYRRLLQVLGTDCIRAIDPDFWVKAAVAQMTDTNGKYVFDDVRFPNEAEVISGYNVMGLWNIEVPGLHAANGHASEQHAGNMGEFFTIQNIQNGFDYLHTQVDTCLDFVHDEMVRRTPIEAP